MQRLLRAEDTNAKLQIHMIELSESEINLHWGTGRWNCQTHKDEQNPQRGPSRIRLWKWDTASANTKDENRNRRKYKSRNSLWDGGEGKHSRELPSSTGASRHPTRPIIFTVELKVIKSRSRIKEWGTQEPSSGLDPPNQPGIGDLGPGLGHPPNAAPYRQAGAMENSSSSFSKALSASGDQLKPVDIQKWVSWEVRSSYCNPRQTCGRTWWIPGDAVAPSICWGRPLHHGVVIFCSAFMLQKSKQIWDRMYDNVNSNSPPAQYPVNLRVMAAWLREAECHRCWNDKEW